MRVGSSLLILAVLLLARPSEGLSQSEPMQRASAPHGMVAYHVMGEAGAVPLVVINGGPGLDHQYLHLAPVWERMASERRLVFFDQPGTGQSYPIGPADSLTVADVLDAIRAVQDALGVDRVALLGHSWGGYLAMAFAVHHPESTESVILVGTAAPNWVDTEVNFAPLFPDSLQRGPGSFNNAEDIRRHLAMSFYSPTTRQVILHDFTGLPFNSRQASLLSSDATNNDLWSAITEIEVPVLVGTGRFDANVAPRTSWQVHQTISGSRFVVWERSGHYPMIEEPDEFVRTLSEFLEESVRP